MADSQSSLENQLKRHVLVCVKASSLIKWKVNLGDFPADPDTEVHCIGIKTFELIFQLSFELNFERFDANFIFFSFSISLSFPISLSVNLTFHFTFLCKQSHGIRHENVKTSGISMKRFGNTSHDDIQKLMDNSKNKNTTKAIARLMNGYYT